MKDAKELAYVSFSLTLIIISFCLFTYIGILSVLNGKLGIFKYTAETWLLALMVCYIIDRVRNYVLENYSTLIWKKLERLYLTLIVIFYITVAFVIYFC